MEADPRCEIEIEIRVVDHVQAPQGGHVMKENVLDIDKEIEEDHPGDNGNSVRHLEMVQKTPPS